MDGQGPCQLNIYRSAAPATVSCASRRMEFALVFRLWVLAVAALACAAGAAGPAYAHFQTGYAIRVVHFVPEGEGLRVFYRISFALVVANGLGAQREDGSYDPAPYTWNEVMGEIVVHHIDLAKIRRDVTGLAKLVVDGHVLRADGQVLPAEILAARVQPRGLVPPFNNAAEAEAATTGSPYPDDGPEVDANSALIDVAVFYRAPSVFDRLTIGSDLHPGRIGPHDVVNLLSFERIGDVPTSRQFNGFMAAPETVYERWWLAATSYLRLGVLHILGGLDHVFFVLCLAIGASTLQGLAWRVTGFTLGHSATLVAGTLGYVPTGAWFAPLIEIGIALSIIYAGATALIGIRQGAVALLVTMAIGLLHGFGFSFMLRELVGDGTAGLPFRLGFFNLGIELGQLAIVAAFWTAMSITVRTRPDVFMKAREVIGVGAIWVAAVWCAERFPTLMAAI